MRNRPYPVLKCSRYVPRYTSLPPRASHLAHLLPLTRLVRRLQLSAATHASLEHVLRPLDGYCRRLLRGRVATRASTRVPPRHQLYRATTKSPIVPHECGSSPSSTRLPPRRRRTSSSCRCCRPTTHVSHRFMHRLVGDCKHPAAHAPRSRESRRFSRSRLDLHLFEHRLVRRTRESVVGPHLHLRRRHSPPLPLPPLPSPPSPCLHSPASPSHAFPALAHTSLCAME